MTDTLDCRRAQELFSDHADGSLNEILRADLRAHLTACDACRALRGALDEVIAALRSHPSLEPAAGLAQRAAQAALETLRAQPSPRRPSRAPAVAWPSALRLAAALALVAGGAGLLLSGPESLPSRVARRLADQTENALFYAAERKDRVVEDVRILRVVIGAAFEGRLDRVNDRFDDYRKMIEKRAAQAPQEKKKIGKNHSNSAQASLVGRGGSGKERSTT